MGDCLAGMVGQPSFRLSDGSFFFLANLLLVERRIGNRPGDGSIIVSSSPTTAETWLTAIRSISSCARSLVSA